MQPQVSFGVTGMSQKVQQVLNVKKRERRKAPGKCASVPCWRDLNPLQEA